MDTNFVYLPSSDGNSTFLPAPSEESSIAVLVHDGRNSLYVTFNEHSLSLLNFSLPLPTQPNQDQYKKHPLVGAELLITIPTSDIYGCFCAHAQVKYNGILASFVNSNVQAREYHYLFCLKPQHVEFVQFSPLPDVAFNDLIAPRCNRISTAENL